MRGLGLLLALLSNKTEPFFAAVTLYNRQCPKNHFLLAKSCTEVYDPQQYLLKLQVTASANSIFLLDIFFSVQSLIVELKWLQEFSHALESFRQVHF